VLQIPAWPLFSCLAAYLAVVAVASPVQAVVRCKGDATTADGAVASGADCGVLRLGDTVALDLTAYFDNLNDPAFRDTLLMVGVTTTGGTPLAFTDLQVVVNGDTLGYGAFNGPIAVWGSAPNQPFGSATKALGYQAANPSGSFGRYQSVDISFDAPGFGGFSSAPASPKSITLQSVNSFQIRATLAGLSKPSAANIVRFDVGPAGVVPADKILMQESGQGSGFGGYFTTQVPGPLPLGAAAAALAWSRRLRQKLRAGQSIPPTHAAPRP
jgi:hypothetical protein